MSIRHIFLGIYTAGIALYSASSMAFNEQSRLRVRTVFGLSTMVSEDQLNSLGYDQVGLVGDALLAYPLLSWLEPYGGMIFSSPQETGGLLAPNMGLMASIYGDGFRPYAQIDMGVGFSGREIRPLFRAGLGIDVPLSTEFTLGPLLGYGQLIQWDTPTASTDARFVWAGCSVSYQYIAEAEPQPPKLIEKIIEKERIITIPPAPTEPSSQLIELIEKTLPTASSRLELLAPVLFKFDSERLEPIGVAMLHEVAILLHRRTDIELIEIQGYADSRGSASYNRDLSRRRAERVYEWLVEHGVDHSRLRTAGEGATSLVEIEKTESAHQQNRRVIFRVIRLREP